MASGIRNLRLVWVLLFTSLSSISIGQNLPEDSLKIEITPYGSFRGHIALYDGEMQIQENASRIGFEVAAEYRNIRYFAGTELAINFFRSLIQFNADGNTNSGFIAFDRTQENQVFSTRLGYLGIDFGKKGKLTIGKQWGVYYDIAGTTDQFNVFGAQASAVYVGKSDGSIGTGRASQAITYRIGFGKLQIGLQASFLNNANNKIVDGYGVSGRFEVAPGLNIGGAYVQRYLEEELIDRTLGIDGQPSYYTAGISYFSDTWDVAVVYANETNGDLTEILVEEELVANVFDAWGIESFLKFKKPKYSLLFGFNLYYPDVDNTPINEDFGPKHLIFGAEYKPIRFAFIYGEYRYARSKNQFGIDEFDVLTIGLRIDIQRTWSKYIPR